MSDIQRYRTDRRPWDRLGGQPTGPWVDRDGDWVRHADHLAALEAEREKVRRLEAKIDEMLADLEGQRFAV